MTRCGEMTTSRLRRWRLPVRSATTRIGRSHCPGILPECEGLSIFLWHAPTDWGTEFAVLMVLRPDRGVLIFCPPDL